MKKKILFRSLLFLLIIPSTFFALMPTSSAQSGQLSNENGWTQPINLSNSGSTSNPQLIIDNGQFHAIWIDAYDGFMTSTSNDGNNWSKPVPVFFPFEVKDASSYVIADTKPVLIADTKGHIHAFWRDSKNTLFYSRVISDNFNSGDSWDKAQRMAGGIVGYDALVDNAGTIHLAFVRNQSTDLSPAGIYYRESGDFGSNWSNSQLIYQSQYLRSINSDQANVKITNSSDNKSVYVVWDNRPLKRIFYSKSDDRGGSWVDPVELKQPDSNFGSLPYKGTVITKGNNILFVWQAGTPGADCTLISQSSEDNGKTWSQPISVFKNYSQCPQNYNLIITKNNFVLLISSFINQVLITAWNGSFWSNFQPVITSFTNVITSNAVALGAQNVFTGIENQLYTIGIDQGAGGDVWFSSMSATSLNDWFPPPSKWSTTSVITSISSDISTISLVADNENNFYAFWIQDEQLNDKTISVIYCSKWNGDQWTKPITILSSLQIQINQLDVYLNKERILIAWSKKPGNNIFYSSVNAAQALFSSEWATPVKLSTNQITGISPKILMDSEGNSFVTYTKPINENRGVYVVSSVDGGKNWSKPIQVFDALAAGWDIVDSPQIAVALDNSLNIIWAKKSFPGDGLPVAFYTSRSTDRGSTWSKPGLLIEGSLSWNQIVGINNFGELHQLWQENDISAQVVIWHQFSKNNGVSWSLPASITNPEKTIGSSAVTIDLAGRLHLFQAVQDSSQTIIIKYRLWDKDRWTDSQSIIVNDNNGFVPDSLIAAVSQSGRLGLAYQGKVKDLSTGLVMNVLFFSNQTLEVPVVINTSLAIPTNEPTSTPENIVTLSPTKLSTITETPTQSGLIKTNPEPTNNSWLGLILGSGLVIIPIAFLIYFLARRKRS